MSIHLGNVNAFFPKMRGDATKRPVFLGRSANHPDRTAVVRSQSEILPVAPRNGQPHNIGRERRKSLLKQLFKSIHFSIYRKKF